MKNNTNKDEKENITIDMEKTLTEIIKTFFKYLNSTKLKKSKGNG